MNRTMSTSNPTNIMDCIIWVSFNIGNLQKGLVAKIERDLELFHGLNTEPAQVDLDLLAVADLYSLLEPALTH